MSTEAMKLQEIMSQAQVFASAWSLVGGRFDGGNAMDEAEVAKNELHQMVAEALAQPQQEPVAWMSDRAVGFKKSEFGATPTVPLYTSPPAQRKPLTDAQIGSCIDEVNLTSQYGHHHFGWHKQFARAVEAAHGITGEQK